ncbi:MAG TPA: GNAT family N-acetyltransferase, partial [Trebonia sp.]|nr:GNAT family N-acetyltransferase [Trebonia sp.]
KAMHEAMSPDNAYLRFFSASRLAATQEASRVCRERQPGQATLLALSGEEVVGCASYEREGEGSAEVAFAVADRLHHTGIATLLLEHLVSRARDDGITRFTAVVLAENTAMLRVFAGAGLPVRRRFIDGVIEVTVPLPRGNADTALDAYLAAVARREGSADAASLQHLFAPQSVAVIGAGRRAGTVGRAVLDNIRTGGYQGRLYAVNPHARYLGGVRCLPAVADLPEAPELAVIAVPPAAVLGIAEACGARGVKALVVITTGLDVGPSADLLAACRRHGMRLVGPGSFGIAVPGTGLDATFAAAGPRPGSAGLVMESGGLGLAMAAQLSRLGIGISSFASVGSKLDVSGNDLLLWWEHDGITRLAILYIESFGNPRKFARTARRVAATMPVLTVDAGDPAAAEGHRPATTLQASRQALFKQAGIITTRGLGELTETAALLATQALPRGRSVAIVSNVGAAAALAASACADHGLTVHQSRGSIRRRLRALVPPGGSVTGPVDVTAAVSSAAFRHCLELLAGDEGVDAVIAIVLPTAATGDLTAAIQQADVPVPMAAVVLDQAESLRLLCRGDRRIPAYDGPEAPARALAQAAAYAEWQAEPKGDIPALPGVTADPARDLVHRFLTQAPGGGWLAPDDVTALLACYGLAPVPATAVRSQDEAVTEAASIAGPVVLKADVEGLAPGAGGSAVRLGLSGEADVRAAYEWLTAHYGDRLRGIWLQPMITGGTEVAAGATDDHVFGPLIILGTGRAGAGLQGDRVMRLAPLTTTDVDRIIGSASDLALSRGYPRAADFSPSAREALRGLLLRISRLAEDLPEITEVSLSPVIIRPDGAFIVNARIKAMPSQPQDPYLRRLR